MQSLLLHTTMPDAAGKMLFRDYSDILVMSVGFLFVISATGVVQSFIVKLLGPLGSASIGLSYGSLALGALIVEPVISRIGSRSAMFVGSTTYTLLVLSLVTGDVALILVASTVIGFGASILWGAQGTMLAECTTDENRGQWAGIFWGVFTLWCVGGGEDAATPAATPAPCSCCCCCCEVCC